MNIKGILRSLAAVAVIMTAGAAQAAPPSNVSWSVTVDSLSPREGRIVWTADINDGWHIYGDEMPSLPDPNPTTIEIDPVDGLTFTGPLTPSRPASKHYDDVLKLNLPWWDGTVSFTRGFKLDDGTDAVSIGGTVRYMACNNNACTPPAKYRFDVSFGGVVAKPVDVKPDDKAVTVVSAPVGDSGEAAAWWAPVDMNADESTADTPWWSILLFGFAGGLLALLTPCVWPMIPMTVSFFLKKSKNRSKSIADAVTYGLSIIVIYLVLGIAITMAFGAGKLNEIATGAVFNLIFFGLLVLFAVSFFGAFDIKLPSKCSNGMDSRAESTTGVVSIFFMAFTLVLVSFSCTGPIIGTLLVEAASQGAVLGPAIGMGGFALGLALPFGLFAFFPSLLKEMPRSGGWLNSVKVVLGFVELILSLKFLSVADLAYGWHILDREVFLSIWIVLFVLLGLYLLGKLRFPHDTPKDHTSVGGFFLAVIPLAFAVYLVPGLWGAPLKSISAFAPPLTTQDFNLYGGTFKEFHDYDEGMAYAEANRLPVIVDFSGYACVNCRKMEGAVFDTPEVRSVIENGYVLIKLMVDDKASLAQPFTVEEYGSPTVIETVGEKWSYLQRHKFGINSQPYYVLLDNAGKPLMPARTYDENVGKFVDWLNEGAAKYAEKR